MEAMDYVVRILFGATTTAAASASVRVVEQQQSDEDRNVSVAMVVMTWMTLGVCFLTVLVILGLRYGTMNLCVYVP